MLLSQVRTNIIYYIKENNVSPLQVSLEEIYDAVYQVILMSENVGTFKIQWFQIWRGDCDDVV